MCNVCARACVLTFLVDRVCMISGSERLNVLLSYLVCLINVSTLVEQKPGDFDVTASGGDRKGGPPNLKEEARTPHCHPAPTHKREFVGRPDTWRRLFTGLLQIVTNCYLCACLEREKGATGYVLPIKNCNFHKSIQRCFHRRI